MSVVGHAGVEPCSLRRRVSSVGLTRQASPYLLLLLSLQTEDGARHCCSRWRAPLLPGEVFSADGRCPEIADAHLP